VFSGGVNISRSFVIMFAHVRSTQLLMLALVCCAFSGIALGADRVPIDPAVPILTPDDPFSIAVIELPSGETIPVSIVTASDAAVADLLRSQPLDPTLPVRVARTVRSPGGEIVHANIVEIGRRTTPELDKRAGRIGGGWVVNDELPFTAEAELDALLNGEAVHISRAGRTLAEDGPTCHLSGLPVVEILVWFDPDTNRTTAPNYRIRIVDPQDDGAQTSSMVSGDGVNGGGGEEDQPPTDGADPIGSPDRVPPRSE
jgi:hypothetical protein